MDYTKGPWTWKKSEFGFKSLVDENGEDIIWYTTDDDGFHCKEENKSLLEAAPDMYEALKEVEYSTVLDLDGDYISCCPICDVWAGEEHKDYCEIGNALSKAEGRNDQ